MAGVGAEREVMERGTERGAGVKEIGLKDARKFYRSRSAHKLWSWCRSVRSPATCTAV